jgi:chitinase
LAAGVAASKLGIGIAFYAYLWTGGTGTTTGGVSQPRQSWSTAPTVSTPSYKEIMSAYYQSGLYHWDTSAQAAYLSVTNTIATNDMFISYDDQRTCQSKVSYARNLSLGGVMIWELAQDHQPGQTDPLLQSLKQALATPGPMGIQNAGTSFALSFAVLPLGLYRVEWTSNLTGPVWNTLTTTNIFGQGGMVQVTDQDAGESLRFYRVQTPP